MRRRAVTAILACVAFVGCGGDNEAERSTATTPPVPGPIIGAPPAAGRDPLRADERAAARAATTDFLGGYLPYLYGRARPSEVQPVTSAVAQVLRAGRARVTPAQAQRRPRVQALELVGQSPRSALVTVTVVDGGPAPFRLVLTAERQDGRWLIADLGDDR